MQHSLSVQNNRYIKQTPNLPTGLTISTQSYQTIPNYIPSVPAKTQVSTPYGAQKLVNTMQAGTATRKWDDIITNPTLAQSVLKTSENTVTFRSPTNTRKLSNKELLAKADLILARSPKKFEGVGSATQKETTTITSSNIPLYPVKSLQVLTSPPSAYTNTFASPVKVNMPLSYPTSISREITSLQFNNYGIHEHARTTAPALNIFTPPQILSPSSKEKLDEVVDKIIRREGHAGLIGASPLRQDAYVYKTPIQTQAITEHRQVPVLTSAPRVNPYISSLSSGAQRQLSELSEIQRDFHQLKVDSQKSRGQKEALTPTPFVSGYGNINVNKASSFGAELLEDDENRLESDRESRRELYVESIPKKEARINRYINPKQQETPRVYKLEPQSGGSKISRNPYRKQTPQREAEFIAVSNAREFSPENNEVNSEAFRGVKQTTERNRITSSEYMVEIERREDFQDIRRSIAIEEELKRRDQQEKMAAGFSERGGQQQQIMLSPKSEGVVMSPSNEYASSRGHGESGESWRREERVNKFSNKVEVSVEVRPDMVGKGKQPRAPVLSKTEKFFG